MFRQRIVATGLAPILLAQGLYVRRVTPRLPEARGERSGLAGTGPPLRLLIAGDSAAAGVGASTQLSALSGQLVERLARDFFVSWRLIARTGNTIDDAIAQLDAEIAEPFDVAVVSIGVNDVTRGTPVRRWRQSLNRLVELLAHKGGVRHALLSAIPPMHAFPALPNPLAWYLGSRAQHLNRISSEWAGESGRCEFVQPSFPLAKDLIASDGFHPGPAAYSLWAEHLAALIRRWVVHDDSRRDDSRVAEGG
jgi:lysophospholipase L1-like esterase